MGAALSFLILAIIAFAVFAIACSVKSVLYGIAWAVVGIVNFIRHENMMRPKERYYRM